MIHSESYEGICDRIYDLNAFIRQMYVAYTSLLNLVIDSYELLVVLRTRIRAIYVTFFSRISQSIEYYHSCPFEVSTNTFLVL